MVCPPHWLSLVVPARQRIILAFFSLPWADWAKTEHTHVLRRPFNIIFYTNLTGPQFFGGVGFILNCLPYVGWKTSAKLEADAIMCRHICWVCKKMLNISIQSLRSPNLYTLIVIQHSWDLIRCTKISQDVLRSHKIYWDLTRYSVLTWHWHWDWI